MVFVGGIIKEVICKECSETFKAHKVYCHKQKTWRYKIFCDRKCAAIYNGRLNRKPKKPRLVPRYPIDMCLECGSFYIKKVSNHKYCSTVCRVTYNSKKTWGEDNWQPRICRYCGIEYRNSYGSIRKSFCSKRCANKFHKYNNNKSVYVLRRAGYKADYFSPFQVFERDKWKCRICGCKTPKGLRGTYEDDAPELDHIIPLSKGGSHTTYNTQCACRRCNSSKSNRTIKQGEQLFIQTDYIS